MDQDFDEAALLALLLKLGDRGYAFVTPTPQTHGIVAARSQRARPGALRDIFGWNLPFQAEALEPELLDLLRGGGLMTAAADGLLRSRVRVSSLASRLFVHSAFPTEEKDAVFFGPDSYRFASLIERELSQAPLGPAATVVDIGTGAGVGAIVAGDCCPGAALIGTDINPAALRFAAINAKAAGLELRTCLDATLACAEQPIDLALANPPYMMDDQHRDYRDGGSDGAEVAVRMAREALGKLAPGGRLILYTGSSIVDGEDRLHAQLVPLAATHGCTLRYREIDPDVFGEDLREPTYREVERIAVVAAVFTRDPDVSNAGHPGTFCYVQ